MVRTNSIVKSIVRDFNWAELQFQLTTINLGESKRSQQAVRKKRFSVTMAHVCLGPKFAMAIGNVRMEVTKHDVTRVIKGWNSI